LSIYYIIICGVAEHWIKLSFNIINIRKSLVKQRFIPSDNADMSNDKEKKRIFSRLKFME